MFVGIKKVTIRSIAEYRSFVKKANPSKGGDAKLKVLNPEFGRAASSHKPERYASIFHDSLLFQVKEWVIFLEGEDNASI